MANYFAEGADGQFYGPIDETGLSDWAREGRIHAASRIREEATGTVVAASQVPALMTVFHPMAAAPSAYPQTAYPPQPYAQPMNPQVVGYATPTNMTGGPALFHQLSQFSVAGVVLLHIFTLGIFSFFYFNLMHGKLPKNRYDDPSGGKALGFCFIPFFNLYWIFFSYLRLIDRINEQRVARGLPPIGKGWSSPA